ncbi:hypothetical protein [Halobellus inordinatus]|uniref:hypothetical protein n=1 Tax=Halobellus inordinatus TaxID=1126236 RepID=UPI0021144C25|nr:hypothetical protein [Halobellus ramosii]
MAKVHADGLEREQMKFVLDDFYQVQNPRRMADEYFDLVLEKFDVHYVLYVHEESVGAFAAFPSGN